MTDDWRLLRRYVGDGDEAAFSELTKRYTNLVYGVSLREVQNPQLAEDIAQAVFLILARKAGTLHSGTALPSWLFQTTLLAAKNAMRQEGRLKARERKAAEEMHEVKLIDPMGDVDVFLHEAIAALPGPEKSAVLLRYFENNSLRDVGEALGISEAAAGMRVTRGVEKLRRYLLQRNIVLTGVALAAGLEQVFHPAPAHCAAVTGNAGMAAGASNTNTIVQGVLHAMRIQLIKSIAIAGIAVIGVSALSQVVRSAASQGAAQKQQPGIVFNPVNSGPASPPATGPGALPANPQQLKFQITYVSVSPDELSQFRSDQRSKAPNFLQNLRAGKYGSVSNPTIITGDGVKATVSMTRQISYSATPGPGQPPKQYYLTAGSTVSVLGHILKGDDISTSVEITDTEPAPAPPGVQIPGGAPVMNQREVETIVNTRSGQEGNVLVAGKNADGSESDCFVLLAATILPSPIASNR